GILRHALFSANLALDLPFAELIRAGQHPAEDRFVFAARRLRVSQAEQVAVRPAVALLIFHRLEGQAVSLAADVPTAHRVAQTATPAPQGVHVLREVEQVRADAADLPELLECERLGFSVAVSGHQGQGEDRGVVLRSTARIADFDDAIHGANTVGLDAADQSVVVLLHEILFGDVIGAAFGTEDQETVETGPVIHFPRVAAGRIRNLVRARNRLRLRGDSSV